MLINDLIYTFFSTAVGFEPTRAMPNGFQVHLLNHSDKLSIYSHAETRTRVNRVKADYPNRLDYMGIMKVYCGYL